MTARYPVEQVAGHFASPVQDGERFRALKTKLVELWSQDYVEHRECPRCSFGFAAPYIAGDAAFYALAFGASGYGSDKWEYERTLKVLESGGFGNGRCLEIGAGAGKWLDIISPRFYPKSAVTAVEYNETTIAEMSARGYTAIFGDESLVADRSIWFEAIFMFQVLEHRDDPHRVFSNFQQLLEDGGSVFLAMPNPVELSFAEANGMLIDMAPVHIGRWTKQNLEDMAGKYGLKVVAYDREPLNMRRHISKDLIHSFMRSSQSPGTLSSWAYPKRKTRLGKLLCAGVILGRVPLRVPKWLKAWRRGDDVGGSHWAHLKKVARLEPERRSF